MEDHELVTRLARSIEGRYYGKYRGFVADNDDPDKRGRLRLRVPSVLGDADSGWALPCLPFGGAAGHGLFLVPEVGAQVWVEFEEGDVSSPVWTGTFWQASGDAPGEATENDAFSTRLLKTPGGHWLRFDDKSDQERVVLHHAAGADLAIDDRGTITLTDPAANTITLDAQRTAIAIEDGNGNALTLDASGVTVEDASGNKVEMTAKGITVTGAQVVIKGSAVMLGGEGGEPVVKGTSLLAMLNTHVHTSGAPGSPTSPPVVPLTAAQLSSKVTTS
jgi:uncharacterized protein involved in type VI secretion and phage assembly